ncbi:MAG TPA: nickel-dependent hydrogenase large subunit [Mycobacterium sp.]|nr:nickel-dependent hydrogenase large subunit [Mycobacterium sp.]
MREQITVDLNRVEGDLEVRLDVEDNTVIDSWCVGTMYRGYEQVLVGRAPGDVLVIVPRICGICSTAQLYAGVRALEDAWGVQPAPNGVRVRNLCLMAEAVMNDARQTFLMFCPDFCHPAYRSHPSYPDLMAAFEPPIKGHFARQAVMRSKGMLGVITAFAGQWPHATYMAPGGVTCDVTAEKLAACETAIDAYQSWYEHDVLGCSSEQWLQLHTAADLFGWLADHSMTAAGLYAGFGRSIGLQDVGRGTPHLLSCGCYPSPEHTGFLMPGGYLDGAGISPFDHRRVREHTRYSWFSDDGPTHPWGSVTRAEHGADRGQYSHAKATRYAGEVVQLGPMVDMFLAGDPLITSWMQAEGPNAWLRQFARLHRPVVVMELMRRTIAELRAEINEPAMVRPIQVPDEAEGFGAVNAARGTLCHWICIRDAKISNYQVITPTTWNASPRDSDGRRGHWEESFVGLTIADQNDPPQLGHIVRSHDACLVCTTHMIRTGQRRHFGAF